MTDKKNQCVDDTDEMPELCKQCTARHQGICGALTPSELTTISKISTQKKFSAGHTLVSDEEEFPFFANVLEGVVKLSKILPDGRQQIVGLQFAPDFMGRPFHSESSLSVESATDSLLCTIPRKQFEDMLSKSPELQNRLLKQTLVELDASRNWLVTLGRKNASEKVASYLYMISQNCVNIDQTNGVVSFDLPLTRADTADFLGLTIETVSRQLSKLKKAETIAISHNRHIDILDIEALKMAGGD